MILNFRKAVAAEANLARLTLTTAIVLTLASPLWAQTDTPPAKPENDLVETFYLSNTNQPNDAREIEDAIRTAIVPSPKVDFVASQNALIVRAVPSQMPVVHKIVADLDRLKKTYRLTYTITESDQGNRIGTQHFAMVVVSGQRTTLKQGSKVPVSTGTYTAGSASASTQFTYLDVGINLDATVDDSPNGVRLRSKAEQSSIAESAIGPQDPIVRQSVLEGTSVLTLGKPLILGSLDIPGSTRHLDIEAVVEMAK